SLLFTTLLTHRSLLSSFLLILRPPTSTLFPTRRSSDLALPTAARLGEHVQEDHHVRVAFRVMLVDPELAATSGCPPVHVPDPVTRDELTDVGELDPLRLLPRHMVSREDLRLGRPQ